MGQAASWGVSGVERVMLAPVMPELAVNDVVVIDDRIRSHTWRGIVSHLDPDGTAHIQPIAAENPPVDARQLVCDERGLRDAPVPVDPGGPPVQCVVHGVTFIAEDNRCHWGVNRPGGNCTRGLVPRSRFEAVDIVDGDSAQYVVGWDPAGGGRVVVTAKVGHGDPTVIVNEAPQIALGLARLIETAVRTVTTR